MSPLHPIIAALPTIIAHRGASGTAPENTLAAIERAAMLGARAIELDVMLSADGYPVIIHDRGLARTTNAMGQVARRSLAEIRSLDAGSWFAPEFAGERVPRLEEALGLIAELGMALNLEIKPSRGKARETAHIAARVTGQNWPQGLPLLVSSSSEAGLRAFGEAQPGVPLGLISGAVPRDWRRRLAGLGCISLHAARDKISAAAARRIRDAGFGLLAHTVNQPAEAERLFEMGIDAIFTDHPERFTAPPARG